MPTNKKGYWSKNGGANYKKYQGTAKAKKERASRNKVRGQAEKAGKVKKGDGKEVHHKNGNARDNSVKNLGVVLRKFNRRDGAKKANKSKGKGYKKAKTS